VQTATHVRGLRLGAVVLLCVLGSVLPLTGAASASAGHVRAHTSPTCTAGLTRDTCTVVSSTSTSLTISYTVKYVNAQCAGGVTSGCVYQLFLQLGISGYGSFTTTPAVTSTCPGRAPFQGSGDYVPLYDYPLPVGTSITCTAKWSWPTGEYAQAVSVNATELDGGAITLPNSDHSYGVSLPAPPPVASFSFHDVAGEPGTVLFTDTSTTLTGKPLVEAWSASDESAGTGVTWSHEFQASGEYTVELKVTDVNDLSDSTTREVQLTYTSGTSATITVKEVLAPSSDKGRFNLLVNGGVTVHYARNGIQGVANVRPGRFRVSQLATTVGLTNYAVAVACTKNGKADVRAAATLVVVSVATTTREICTFTDTRTPVHHCDVPELLGLPLAAAHAALSSSSCALGAVTTTGTPGAGKVQRVIAQAPAAYLVLPLGTKVALHVHWGT
jgi:PKD domain